MQSQKLGGQLRTASDDSAALLAAESKLNPWFITGFADAEGCFLISVVKDPKRRQGWHVRGFFEIGLHLKDVKILNAIKFSLGGIGIITTNENLAFLKVSSLKELLQVIDHFDKYPLISQKYADYLLLREIVILMNQKEHLTKEGLEKSIANKASMNKGISDILQAAFPNVIPTPRPKVVNKKIMHPYWLSGFAAGDGSFFIHIYNDSRTKLGETAKLVFKVSQHSKPPGAAEAAGGYP